MENFRNILLVVNPVAGDIDKSDVIREVEAYAHQHHRQLQIYQTTGQDDQRHLAGILNSFDAHRVLIAGGDGSIKLLAEAMRDQVIPMGILPTGSANGLARNLALPTNVSEALDVALGNRLIDIDALCINNHLCLHLSDLGLNAELIQHYEKSNVHGKIGYIIQSVPTLLQSGMPFTFEVSIGDDTFRREGILLAIANARKYGTGAVINPTGAMDDGKFEVLVFKKFNVIDILKTLDEDTEPDPDFVESFSTTHANIHCQQPVPFQIDGEYCDEVQDLDVSILPKHLKVAVGGELDVEK